MMRAYRPFLMGLVMGPLMLWMFHEQISGAGASIWGLVIFIGAHLALGSLLIVAALFAGRMSARIEAVLHRLHRPQIMHIGGMLTGAALSVASVHFVFHGIA